MWNIEFDVRIMGSDNHFINTLMRDNNGCEWRLTGVYGWPDSNLKHKSWEMIDKLGYGNDTPWIVGGDFNEILLEAEKNGGSPCDFNSLYSFRNCLDRNGLVDLGANGHHFTWSNKRTEGFIEERLDRFVATQSWKSLFPSAYV